jgi:hypothetical protein
MYRKYHSCQSTFFPETNSIFSYTRSLGLRRQYSYNLFIKACGTLNRNITHTCSDFLEKCCLFVGETPSQAQYFSYHFSRVTISVEHVLNYSVLVSVCLFVCTHAVTQ